MATANLTRQRAMTFEDYVAFERAAGVRHEFVRGVPRMMAGGTKRHERISLRAAMELGSRLRGSRCEAFGSNLRIKIPNGNVRYADASVDCGRGTDLDLAATEPVLVVEVLSPSTTWFDQTRKLEDYKAVPSMRTIILLSQTAMLANLHRRAGEAWVSSIVEGADAVIVLPDLEIELPLATLYEGVVFDEAAPGAEARDAAL